MKKTRLGDLNIYCPKRTADWRISVNLELPGELETHFSGFLSDIESAVPHPVGISSHTRRKDRLTYSHEEFNIDLTQVTSKDGPNATVCLLFCA
jgi:polynucleotide 5'-triphosphatase